MLAVTTQQDEKRLENEDQPVLWVGEPLRLDRDGIGDNFWLGLVSVIQLPGVHVHPAIREAGEQILAAQAELDQLRRKLAARPGEFNSARSLHEVLAVEAELASG